MRNLFIAAMLGPKWTDDKAADILNGVVEWKDEELPRQVEKMLNDMELQECEETAVPGTKTAEQEDDVELLDRGSAKRYRSVVARGNFLARVRSVIMYIVKELCWEMSIPSRGSWRRLKKLCRYLRGTPNVMQKMKIEQTWTLWRTCTSTMTGRNAQGHGARRETWSTAQPVVARSSGEAECYAAEQGAAEGMAVQSLLCDLGLKVTIEVHTDSSACNRKGLGKLGHVEVALLWLQQHVQSGNVIFRRIAGSVNPADIPEASLNLVRRTSFSFNSGLHK